MADKVVPLGVSPQPEYTLGYGCAMCGSAIPDSQPESYRGYCDPTCRRLYDGFLQTPATARRSTLQVADADVNEAESRELLEGTALEHMLPERLRRTLYEAGYNVDTVSVDEENTTYVLDVRAAAFAQVPAQRCTVTIKWEV